MPVARCLNPLRHAAALLLVLCLGAAASVTHALDGRVPLASLPAEARDVFKRLERGGPYRYDRDGAVFGNYERLLPSRSRGYYREYTVDTPGLTHRGARRLIVGCDRGRAADGAAAGTASYAGLHDCAGPAEVYYTEDHYRSFRRVVP
jgi:ribonuclease T1